MKKLVSIGLWSVGCTFFLFSFCLLAICLIVLSKEQTFEIARRLFAVLIKIMGVRLEVIGRENIKPNTTYLMMGNHQSLFDIFVIPAAIPLCFTGIEAAYHFKLPVWGYLIRKWGCIPIERQNLKNAIKSLEQARQTIASGMHLCVLPEGHRTLTGQMAPFKKGPFYLAKAAGADLLLFGIKGLFDFHPKGRLELKPGKVTVTIGQSISYDSIEKMPVKDIRTLCYTKIRELST